MEIEGEAAPPRCVTCTLPMSYAGRISLPPRIIYRCETCKTEIWVGNAPRTVTPVVSQRPQVQQQQQQQLQTQANPDREE